MQNCFREYPEVYGSELDSDADDEDDLTASAESPSNPSSAQQDSTYWPWRRFDRVKGLSVGFVWRGRPELAS